MSPEELQELGRQQAEDANRDYLESDPTAVADAIDQEAENQAEKQAQALQEQTDQAGEARQELGISDLDGEDKSGSYEKKDWTDRLGDAINESTKNPTGPLVATGLGLADTVIDTATFLTGGDDGLLGEFDDTWDEATKYESEAWQTGRVIMSYVAPSFIGGLGLTKVLGASKAIRSMPALQRGVLRIGTGAAQDFGIGVVNDHGLENDQNFLSWVSDKTGMDFGGLETTKEDPTWYRRLMNGFEESGFAVIGDVLGHAAGKGLQKFGWFKPKDDAAKKALNMAQDVNVDEDTAKAVSDLQTVLDSGTLPKSEAAGVKKEIERLVSQAKANGFSDATASPTNAALQRADNFRQLELDMEAVETLQRNGEPSVYNPTLQTGAASGSSIARKAVEPLANADNQSAVYAAQQGIANGDPPSMLTDSYLKKGIRDGDTRAVIAQEAAKNRDSGSYNLVVRQARNDVQIGNKEQLDSSARLMMEIMEANDADELKLLFSKQRDSKNLGGQNVFYATEGQSNAISLALQPLADMLSKSFDPTTNDISIRVINTLGKEISSSSDFMLKNPLMVDPVKGKEKILDKLEFLLNEYGTSKYIAGFALNNKKFFKRAQASVLKSSEDGWTLDLSKMDGDELAKAQQFQEGLTASQTRNKELFSNLTAMLKNNESTQDGLALIEAFRRTDGDVTNMTKLVSYIDKQLDPRTLFWSPKGGMSLFAQETAALFYANVLSLKSAGSAFVGAFLGLPLKAVNTTLAEIFTALGTGKAESLKAHTFAYMGTMQSTGRALKEAWSVFKKGQANPADIASIARKDTLVALDQSWEAADRAYLKMKAEGTNFGARFMYKLTKAVHAARSNQLATGVSSGLTAIDTGTSSFMASIASRTATYKKFSKNGLKDISIEDFRNAEREHYESFFGPDGLPTEGLTKIMAGEIALNLDTEWARKVTQATDQIPALKTLFAFPNVGINEKMNLLSYTPFANYMGGTRFGKVLKADAKDLDSVKEALMAHEINVNVMSEADIVQKFTVLKREYQTRQGLAAVTGFMLFGHAMNGGVRPPAPMNPAEREGGIRDGIQWGTLDIPGTNQTLSYEGLVEPFKSIFGLFGKIAYNADKFGDEAVENMLGRTIASLPVLMTEGVGLDGVQELIRMFNTDGNGFINAVTGTGWRTLRSLIPQSGNLGVLESMMNDYYQDLDNDLDRYLSKRMPVVSSARPFTIDQLDGEKISESGNNPMIKLFNSLSNTKIKPQPDNVRKLLNASGLSLQSRLLKDPLGNKLPDHMREEWAERIGRGDGKRRPIDDIKDLLKKNDAFVVQLQQMAEDKNNASGFFDGKARKNINVENTTVVRMLNAIMKGHQDRAFAEMRAENEDYDKYLTLGEMLKSKDDRSQRDAQRNQLQTERDRLEQVLGIPK